MCYVHAGTHKTGTTSLQRTLATNDRILADASIFVPRAGRLDAASGHHNIAWELNGDGRFDRALGTFAHALDEIAQQNAARACLSSEDFEYLYARPERLRELADGVRGIGYEPVAIVYLRPQAGYAESLYAELVKHGLTRTFDAFLDTVIETGEFCFNERWRYAFDYERLLAAFAAAFGPRNVIARRYDARSVDVVADFFGLIGARTITREPGYTPSRRLNAGLQCEAVLERFEANLRASDAGRGFALPRAALAAGRFDPIHLRETLRVIRRFNDGNRRLQRRYGTHVPCVSGGDLLRDVSAAVGFDQSSRARRHILARAFAAAAIGEPAAAAAPKPSGVSLRRIGERLAASPFARPARLEAITVVTAAIVATLSLVFGERTARTSLVEFGMLSIVAAASAAVTGVRYAVEAHGIIADDGFFADFGMRLRVAAFTAIGLYALVNAVLDVALARHEPDWISYPGAFATAVAALVLTLVFPVKERLVRSAVRSANSGAIDRERAYLSCAYVAAGFEFVHAVQPAWWIDTSVDVLVAILALSVILRLFRRAPFSVAGAGTPTGN